MNATVLFAWRRTPPPFLIGGAEVSQRILAEQFAVAGWSVVYLGTHEPPWQAPGELETMRARLIADGIAVDAQSDPPQLHYQWRGIDCHALAQADLEREFAARLAAGPDLVITSMEGADRLAAAARDHAPVAAWLHSVSHTSLGVLRGRPHHALAVSHFVLSRIDHPGAVLFHPPFLGPTAIAAPIPAGDLLMVNPVPKKGGDLVRELARRLPDRHFTLVEGWWDASAQFADLPNTTWVPRTDTMDALYAGHRLLLVPSTVQDAFPRVIVEAGLARIPTLGARRGGIPEAVGDGGVLLEPGDPEMWERAIRALDERQLGELGSKAQAHAAMLVRPCLPELTAAGVLPDYEPASADST